MCRTPIQLMRIDVFDVNLHGDLYIILNSTNTCSKNSVDVVFLKKVSQSQLIGLKDKLSINNKNKK